MSAHEGYEVMLGKLEAETGGKPPVTEGRGRIVQRQDGTWDRDEYKTVGNPLEGVDTLFGATASYQAYKKEKPEHRLMLWYRLQGYNVKETATLMGYNPQTVSNVCGQAWFQEAFVRLSTEMGKDAVKTFLEGEILPAFQRVADLARNADSEAVRLAADREIMDRYLGKSTAKVEQVVQGRVEAVVYDIAKLQEEEKRLSDQLKTLTGGGN